MGRFVLGTVEPNVYDVHLFCSAQMLEPTQLRWKCGQVRVTRLKAEDELYTRATVKTDTATNDKGCERVVIVQHPPSDVLASARSTKVNICASQGVKESTRTRESRIELKSLLNVGQASVQT